METVTALDHLGATRQHLLRRLLTHPGGLSVDEIVRELAITTTAVRQHLTALERDGFICKGGSRPTSRRPQALYILTPAGRELFPRNYGLLADRVIEQTRKTLGSDGLVTIMRALGAEAGEASRLSEADRSPEQVATAMAEAMSAAGYEAVSEPGEVPQVAAYNCVFHHLAARFPEVCEYDLAFIGKATGRTVTHSECMVRGGKACRFVLDADSLD